MNTRIKATSQQPQHAPATTWRIRPIANNHPHWETRDGCLTETPTFKMHHMPCNAAVPPPPPPLLSIPWRSPLLDSPLPFSPFPLSSFPVCLCSLHPPAASPHLLRPTYALGTLASRPPPFSLKSYLTTYLGLTPLDIAYLRIGRHYSPALIS